MAGAARYSGMRVARVEDARLLTGHGTYVDDVYIALGTITGGLIGAGVGRRLPAPVLRGIIIAVGIVGIVKIVFFP